MKVLLAAGGTGGHIFPALAVAEALKKRGAEVIFVGVGKELEKKIIPPAGYRLDIIPFSPVTGKGLAGIFKNLFSLPGAIRKGIALLRSEDVRVVFAFGGYPSFIPFLAAGLKRVPRALHEQNVQVGLANKISALFSARVFAVPGAHGFLAPSRTRIEFVPNPVREQFYQAPDWAPPAPGAPFRILVIGGSQGAVSLNKAVMSCVSALSGKNVALVHQTGAADAENVAAFCRGKGYDWAAVHPFVENVAAEYARAHLVISRAGAMSAAEIAAAGRPAVFVPLAIAQGHQRENVRGLVDAGAALVVEQNDGAGTELQSLLPALAEDYPRLEKMAARAREFSRVGRQSSADFLAEQIIALGNHG